MFFILFQLFKLIKTYLIVLYLIVLVNNNTVSNIQINIKKVNKHYKSYSSGPGLMKKKKKKHMKYGLKSK